MEARDALRKSPLLDECQLTPEMFEQVIPRLYPFMKPFVTSCQGQAAEQHAKTSVCGLWSDVERKNIGRCCRAVDFMSNEEPTFIAIDEQTDHEIVHAFRLRKAQHRVLMSTHDDGPARRRGRARPRYGRGGGLQHGLMHLCSLRVLFFILSGLW